MESKHLCEEDDYDDSEPNGAVARCCWYLQWSEAAPEPGLRKAREYVDDSTITTKVKAAIFDDPAPKVFQISVETFKGVVQLSGFVNSAEIRSRAGVVASRVSGVQSVKNSLLVK